MGRGLAWATRRVHDAYICLGHPCAVNGARAALRACDAYTRLGGVVGPRIVRMMHSGRARRRVVAVRGLAGRCLYMGMRRRMPGSLGLPF